MTVSNMIDRTNNINANQSMIISVLLNPWIFIRVKYNQPKAPTTNRFIIKPNKIFLSNVIFIAKRILKHKATKSGLNSFNNKEI
jgi:hypothetical protein